MIIINTDKAFEKNPLSIPDKNSQETRKRRKFSQPDTVYQQKKLKLPSYAKVKDSMFLP